MDVLQYLRCIYPTGGYRLVQITSTNILMSRPEQCVISYRANDP
jgi:hypothetical protein